MRDQRAVWKRGARTRIAIVIVTYNSAADVRGLLPTLEGVRAEGLDLTVVVADNGSQDETSTIVSNSPSVDVVLDLANNGYAAAINAGAEAAGAFDGLLALNADVRLRPGSVAQLAGWLRDSTVGVVAPRLITEDGAVLPSIRREPTITRAWAAAVVGGSRAGRWWNLGETDGKSEHYGKSRDIDWATGAALLISARCWRRVGRWEESFFLYSEETDYCLRARAAGFRVVYDPTAVVEHREGDMANSVLPAYRAISAVRSFGMRKSVGQTVAYAAALVANAVLRIWRAEERAALLAIVLPWTRPTPVRGLALLRPTRHTRTEPSQVHDSSSGSALVDLP